MISSTGTKKELIDFLWEWAESNGDWSKYLVSKIIASEQPLSVSEQQIAFDYFLQSISMNRGLPPLSVIKPIYTPIKKQISLTSISDVQGVNNLAANQTINFGKNITVIYGENGTGKTGYCRILKSLGFSYDPQKVIYSNIAGKTTSQSATIDYTVNGTSTVHHWSGINSNPDLSTISVFNNNCVQISLGDGRNLIVSPIGFHLFNLISGELEVLAGMLNDAIAKRIPQVSWLDNLNFGTSQQTFIASLNAKSTEERLTDLSSFDSVKQAELEKKEIELKKLNRVLLDAQIKSYTTQIIDLNSQISKIEAAKAGLTVSHWESIITQNTNIKQL